MISKSYIDAFDPEGKSEKVCATCGICLQKCPVMKMGEEESLAEIGRLLNGEETERVLKECSFCFNCNNYCPHDLKPYTLIMERLEDQIKATGKGIPSFVQYFSTGKGDTCWCYDVYDQETDEEKKILEKWAVPPPKSKEVLVMGCVGRMIPYGIEHSKVLAELPKYSPRNLCCGELPHRFGDYEYFSELVESSRGLLEKLDTERMITYCGSCGNYYGNIWPNYHGVKLPFEVVSLWEWLWDKYQKGEITVHREIPGKFAISDSCYSSELGDKFFEAIRGVHKAVGMDIVELKNNRNDNLSCGFVSFVRNNFDLNEAAKEVGRKLNQFDETGASDLGVYCPGCFWQLRGPFKELDKNIHYTLEEILCAFGDDPYPASLEDRMSLMEQGVMKKIGEYMESQK